MTQIKKGTIDVTSYFHLRSTSGLSKTGLSFDSAGAKAAYVRNKGSSIEVTLSTLTNPTSAHSAGGFVQVNQTNNPGLYRFDQVDASFVSGADKVITTLSFTGVLAESLQIDLVDNNNVDIHNIVNHASYGNAQLVRAATPANTLSINASGGVLIDELLSEAKVDINDEMLDVLTIDEIAELSASPTATAAFDRKLQWIWQYFKFKRTVTASTETLFKDDGSTILSTGAVSEDATTATFSEHS